MSFENENQNVETTTTATAENTKLSPEERARRKDKKALDKARKNVSAKYPHAKVETLIRASDHPDPEIQATYGQKFVVECNCSNPDCDNTFWAATSDLFQLTLCEDCRAKAKKAKKAAKKAEAKEEAAE